MYTSMSKAEIVDELQSESAHNILVQIKKKINWLTSLIQGKVEWLAKKCYEIAHSSETASETASEKRKIGTVAD